MLRAARTNFWTLGLRAATKVCLVFIWRSEAKILEKMFIFQSQDQIFGKSYELVKIAILRVSSSTSVAS